jgi:hypothetical protein
MGTGLSSVRASVCLSNLYNIVKLLLYFIFTPCTSGYNTCKYVYTVYGKTYIYMSSNIKYYSMQPYYCMHKKVQRLLTHIRPSTNVLTVHVHIHCICKLTYSLHTYLAAWEDIKIHSLCVGGGHPCMG